MKAMYLFIVLSFCTLSGGQLELPNVGVKAKIPSLKQLCQAVIIEHGIDFRALPPCDYNKIFEPARTEYAGSVDRARAELYMPPMNLKDDIICFGCHTPYDYSCSYWYYPSNTRLSESTERMLSFAQSLTHYQKQPCGTLCGRAMVMRGITPKRVADCCFCLTLAVLPAVVCASGCGFAQLSSLATCGGKASCCIKSSLVSVVGGSTGFAAGYGLCYMPCYRYVLEPWQRSLLPDIAPPAILTIDVPDAVPEEASEQSAEDESAAEEEFLLG